MGGTFICFISNDKAREAEVNFLAGENLVRIKFVAATGDGEGRKPSFSSRRISFCFETGIIPQLTTGSIYPPVVESGSYIGSIA